MKKALFIFIFIFFTTNNIFGQDKNQIDDPKTYEEVDAQVKDVCSNILKILNKNEKKIFEKSQKKWLEYRNAECEFEVLGVEESEINKQKSNCMFEITKRRLQDLMASYIILRLR